MSLDLEPVGNDRLREVWPAIRERVAAVCERAAERWVPEDVFAEILVGNSFLWTLPDLSGFLVLRVFATAYDRTLHAWICCNASEDRIAGYLEQLKAIADENGCSRITWESDRRYHRALPGVRVTYAYSIDVGG